MDTKIEIYSCDRPLVNSFASASGTLKRKRVIQIVFIQKSIDRFIFELPLSPSLGEMPEDVLFECMAWDKEISYIDIKSKMLKRSIKYFQWSLQSSFVLSKLVPIKKYIFQTIPIGQNKRLIRNDVLHRYKGSSNNLEGLIKITLEQNEPWSVDFNGSLNYEQWELFCSKAFFAKCAYIEQPLAIGKLNQEMANLCPVALYADEEMEWLSNENFVSSPYSGMVLKPIRHDPDELIKWIEIARAYKIPCVVGGMVCDYVASAFEEFWNKLMTIQHKEFCITSFFDLEPWKYPVYYDEATEIKVNKQIFDYVRSEYKLVKSVYLSS